MSDTKLPLAYVTARYDRRNRFWVAWAADRPLETAGPLFEQTAQAVWMRTSRKKKDAIACAVKAGEKALGDREWVTVTAEDAANDADPEAKKTP